VYQRPIKRLSKLLVTMIISAQLSLLGDYCGYRIMHTLLTRRRTPLRRLKSLLARV
jgi:hypothetical protein